jgi:hypothetical protein
MFKMEGRGEVGKGEGEGGCDMRESLGRALREREAVI